MSRLLWIPAVLAVAALLWIGGEQHRSNCLEDGRAGCTVLPWDSGHAKAREDPNPWIDRYR